MIEEHVVLNIETYQDLIESKDCWDDAKDRIKDLEEDNTALEHLAIECAIDRFRLKNQTLDQCLKFDSDAWSVIKADNLKRIREMGIEDSAIEYVIKCEYYDEHPGEKPFFQQLSEVLGGK